MNSLQLNQEQCITENCGVNSSNRKCPPVSVIVLLVIAVIFVDLPISIYETSIIYDGGSPYGVEEILSILHVLLKGIAAIALVIHLMGRSYMFGFGVGNFSTCSLCHILQVLFCSAFSMGSILRLFSQHYIDVNDHDAIIQLMGIDSQGWNKNQPITFVTLSVMLNPLLFGVLFYDALRETLWALWLMSLCSLISVSILCNSKHIGFTIVYYFLLSGLIFYGMQKNFELVATRELLQEQKLEKEINDFDQNMKQIVGNVAHDLKTVSSN
jgi:hypothetical protein